MNGRVNADQDSRNQGSSGDGCESHRTLLVVDADPLLRWSLVEYLSRWFDVVPTDSEPVAHHLLDGRCVDALIVSDDLLGRAADEIVAHTLERNASACVVRTVTQSRNEPCERVGTCLLEKPFRLHELAELLGVGGLPSTKTPSDQEASGE